VAFSLVGGSDHSCSRAHGGQLCLQRPRDTAGHTGCVGFARAAAALCATGDRVTDQENPSGTYRMLLMGSGTRGVVLAPQSNGEICQWATFAGA
jgi:hypothetical protein